MQWADRTSRPWCVSSVCHAPWRDLTLGSGESAVASERPSGKPLPGPVRRQTLRVFQGPRAALVHRRRTTGQRGATLVEFAFVLPVFILFLFAIIDFGWLFTQFLDVKQGAREGARLAIVNDCTQLTWPDACETSIVEKICDRTSDLDDSGHDVRLENLTRAVHRPGRRWSTPPGRSPG